ncbi:MAG: ABC transporter permease [Desulfobacteraceae bacterium]|nr:MAG: ABC transporter permease [Desulfobacteraceae bacterium]
MPFNPENTLWYDHWLQLKQNRSALLGLAIIGAFVVVAFLAPVLATHDPLVQNVSLRLSKPFENGYLLGSDDFGRDIFSRILYGARISLVIGAIAIGISLTVGTALGLISGFYGGTLDVLIMGLVDVMLAFPYILLAIVIVSILGPSLNNAMIAIGIVGIPRFARIIRAQVLAEKENDYVMVERSLGTSDLELMMVSILPNCMAPIIVQVTLGYAGAILSSAALSFLGLGTQPPTPEWGLMLASAKQFVASAWWVVTFPGVAILLSVLGFNLFGDGLRDILDPRLKD